MSIVIAKKEKQENQEVQGTMSIVCSARVISVCDGWELWSPRLWYNPRMVRLLAHHPTPSPQG
jgi:hypothetical protein